MRQFHNKTMSVRVAFDEKSENGLFFGDRYLPEELLSEIFCYVDYKTLLSCQLVCKRWKDLLQNYVWRKKAEMALVRFLPAEKDLPWFVYYLICKKTVFERNLIKNSSGEQGVDKHWSILAQGGDRWAVESPPIGVPELPADPVFEGRQCCFVTSYHDCIKAQVIDLLAEGFIPYVLDTLQPPIVVSEWYSCRWDCPAVYGCFVNLIREDDEVMESFEFQDTIQGENQNQWHHVSHEFKNYGPGLRKISFRHAGIDKLFWAGHYGSKMSGACVYVKVPTIQHTDTEETETL